MRGCLGVDHAWEPHVPFCLPGFAFVGSKLASLHAFGITAAGILQQQHMKLRWFVRATSLPFSLSPNQPRGGGGPGL